MTIKVLHYNLGETKTKLTKTACHPRNAGCHLDNVTDEADDVTCKACLKAMEPVDDAKEGEKANREEVVRKFFIIAQKLLGWTPQWGNRIHRQAALDLAAAHSWDELESLMEYAEGVRSQEFAPKVYTPHDLFLKMAKLKDYSRMEKRK